MEIRGLFYCSRCMRGMETDGVCPHCGYDGKGEKDASVLEEGTLLNGRYQLGAVIGKGGFGITYAAWDENLDRPVAVKEFFPSVLVTRNTGLSDEVVCPEKYRTGFLEGRLRFERESRLLATLREIPNVVEVLDYFSENETAYIVMEYIHGVTLDAWAAEKKPGPAQTLSFIRPVADALVLLHQQGVVHRDLKPENILVQEDGTVRLIDFGAAMRAERHGETVVLSRGYAPVEQYGKEYGRQGPWSDVYSLAAVIYQLLTGNAPQESLLRLQDDRLASPASANVRIGKKQNAALMAALAVRPEKRTQSMEEFRAELYRLPLPEQVLWRRRMRRRLTAAFCAALFLAAAVAANFTSGLPLGQGLLYSLRGDGWHILREWRGRSPERVLPSRVLGLSVTAVGRDAFRGDETLEQVTMPDALLSLGDQAFYGCSRLRAVYLNGSVREIGLNVFDGAEEDLLLWGSRDGVQDVYAERSQIRFVDGSEMDFEETEGGLTLTRLESAAEILVIPSSVNGKPVVRIGERVKIGSAAEVWFPDDLEEVPGGICENNGRLETVHIGKRTKRIGKGAFWQCGRLSRVLWGESLRTVDSLAFGMCSGLTEITLPEGVEKIGEEAFIKCGSLRSVSMPDSVGSIGSRAFLDCVSLREIRLPEKLAEIPETAFGGCAFETLALPESIRSIGWGAFRGSGLKYLVLPAGLETLDGCVFSECSALEWVLFLCDGAKLTGSARAYTEFSDFPDRFVIGGRAGSLAEWIAGESGIAFEDMDGWSSCFTLRGPCAVLTEPPDAEVRVPWFNADENCPVTRTSGMSGSGVREITLSRFQTRVEDSEFAGCPDLRTVRAPGALEEIGTRAFSGCENLGSVETGSRLRSIGDWAFEGDRSLKDIDLSGVRRIGQEAFFGCSSLSRLNFSDSLTSVGDYAFRECGVRGVVVPGSLTSVTTSAFALAPVKWVVLRPGCREIESFGLIGCSALRALVLPPGMRRAADTAVSSGCPVDVWIYQPDMVIDDLAFYRWEPDADQTPEELYAELPPPVIHGFPGSTAETYAAKRGFTFLEITESYEETAEAVQKAALN